MTLIMEILRASWDIMMQASLYIIFGIVAGGMLKIFLSPEYVAAHLGRGRFSSVFKAAMFGIPIPLCSCGVLPAAASLKEQGANNGATAAFIISTPETGIDSISITWALLDPLMALCRPISAFFAAVTAGCMENFLHPPGTERHKAHDMTCPVDRCCDGRDCPSDEHKRHHTWHERLMVGLKYAFTEIWAELAPWFLAGVLLAGIITVLVPEPVFSDYLGGGISSMLLMLVISIPVYICASASTPIAAALIMKGASPGTALVFLLAGPATNITSLTVLVKILGRRATGICLFFIAITSIVSGVALDTIYGYSSIVLPAITEQTEKILPLWLTTSASLLLLILAVKPIYAGAVALLPGQKQECGCSGCCHEDKR
jgi:uncharacterized membrane protein YraQ (UPF0718 family)